MISTILGIIAFHMWQHFHPQGKDYSHADFTAEVAYRLLTSEEPSASEALHGFNFIRAPQSNHKLHINMTTSHLVHWMYTLVVGKEG